MMKRTPCVGICSTTYGDLVCRGCKRFAHEIVQWNGFDDDQRRTVWQRLLTLRAGAVEAVLSASEQAELRQHCSDGAEGPGPEGPGAGASGADASGAPEPADAALLLYETLQRLAGEGRRLGAADARDLLERIDREFYRRSLAHYERNFRIPAQ